MRLGGLAASSFCDVGSKLRCPAAVSTRMAHTSRSRALRLSPTCSGGAGSDDISIKSVKLPNQAESVFSPTDTKDLTIGLAVADRPSKADSDLDYLSELLAIQTSDGPKALGFFGTRNMGMTHQKLVEVLAYAYVFTGNHIFTSGATGTNAAVIKGALRANCPHLLTVILPQSLSRQPLESQELLAQVGDLVEMPENNEMSLLEASRLCNREIISRVQQVISFAFHDSRLILEAASEAKAQRKIVTLFYLD